MEHVGSRGLLLLLLLATAAEGDLEPTFGRCCAFGANWARESQLCSSFPTPVRAIPSEHQSICITAATICCLRFFRDEQCQKGKQVAQVGQDCVASSSQGGEYFKDCCQGCKLGLFSGSMGMGCSMHFKFGYPWDDAYLQCCNQALPGSTSPNLTGNQVLDADNLYPGLLNTAHPVTDTDDLCARLPGKLCSQVCVSTPGSYHCQCRTGFTLSIDGKTCIQDTVTDRCQVNNPCDHICRDTGVSIECSCNSGFTLKADQRSCEDINECSSGVHGCVAVEQVCYNQVGSYVCINVDGSLSAPGPIQPLAGSPGNLPVDPRTQGSSSYEISNEVAQGVPSFISSSGALGVQGFPGVSRELELSGPSHSQGRCPPGYSFNLETRACDDVDECEVTSGLCGRGALCLNTIGSYTCTHMPVVDCPPGFAFDLNLQSCLDVDECVDGTDNCNKTIHFCVNTQGSYTCQEKGGPTDCIAGYKYSTLQQTCVDVNECAEGLHGCHPEEEVCRNTAGGYECDLKCDEGFQFNSILRTCVDQDECADAPCDPGWECHNTAGSYLCHELPRAFCPAGYKPSNGTASGCEDVDECVEGLHSCNVISELCINEIGKYRCEAVGTNEVVADGNQFDSLPHATFQPPVQECREGFGFDITTRQCLDIDECTVGLDNCSGGEQCINTLGGFLCQPHVRCSPGYAPDPVTEECKDVDECSAGVANCLPGQICFNTPGAFECRVECQDGFRYDPTDAAVCVDVDECLHIPCGPGKQCINTEGSYICTITAAPTTLTTTTTTTSTTTAPVRVPSACPPGFGRNPNSLRCEDLDECLDSVCELGQHCTNTYGSYTCVPLPCNQGYRRNPQSYTCEDVDECEEGLHNCQVGHEQCVNNPGGHDCQLRPCSPGFARDPIDPRHCQDVDECESSPCEADEDCVNSNGSFRCRPLTPCSTGFRRNEENKQCEDIDECIEEAPCSLDERCVNSQGSYRCRSQECPPGYQRNIWGQCRDVNECETGEHTCRIPKEECINSPGSYRCKSLPDCPEGFTRDASSLRCVDVDECAQGSHDCREGERCYNHYGRYICQGSPSSCTGGLRFSTVDRRCIDIDECAESIDSCERTTQTCVNSVGSFRCIDRRPTCDFGYRYNEEQRACVDIDECSEGLANCEEGQSCLNTLGSHQCQLKGAATQACQPGFTFNSTARACLDINECVEGTHDCSSQETCVNHHGDYVCEPRRNDGNIESEVLSPTGDAREDEVLVKRPGGGGSKRGRCPEGFRYNRRRRTCMDIDECVLDPCRTEELCENTQGSYQCKCQPGYFKENPDEVCSDMNECQLGLHSCTTNQRCDNTIGSYACIRINNCGTGYTLNHNTGECDDINECAEGSPCQRNEQCINTLGSYHCRPLLACNVGYEMNELGTQCVDTDECSKGTHQCVGNQVCSNRQGGYICQCPQGFRLNAQRQCQDINECESYHGRVCSSNADCENTEGSYNCNCKKGFKQASNSKSCLDVDECVEVPGICHHNCINIWGTYQCTCRAGYTLASDNRTCTDVNECENFRGRGHLCIGLCVNIPGSFKCTCPDGYNLAADGRTCKDINECEAESVCKGPKKHCVNTRGGYKCNTITCPANYQQDTRHKNRCKRVSPYCLPDDVACKRKPLSYSYNFLPLVSNLTLPALGQVDLFTMRGPLWTITTVQFALELEETRAPAEIQAVTRDYFTLKRTAFNQAVIALVRPIIGPQEVQLSLNMELYQQNQYSGSAVAKLLIYVSEYDF